MRIGRNSCADVTSQIGGLSAPPETFVLDGKQHLLFSAGGGLFFFVLN